MAEFNLDTGRMEARIVQAAMRAGNDVAKVVLERAQARAPVRQIFRGTRNRRRQGVTVRNSQGSITFPGVQPRIRQIRIRNENTGELDQFKGHANSSIPILRSRTPTGGTSVIVGDFRRIAGPKAGKLAKVEADRAVLAKGGRVVTRDRAMVSGQSQLTAQGRAEVRSGRGVFTTGSRLSQETARFKEVGGKFVHIADDAPRVRGERTMALTRGLSAGRGQEHHVGGRLKGELHIEGPVRGETIWWFIVTRTKENGRLYGRDMEYGNKHNAAHPFLRPALHESRDMFRNQVRNEIAEMGRRR